MSWKCPKDGTENPDPDPSGLIIMRIKTVIGKTVCQKFSTDSRFWSNPQFTCEPPPKDEDYGLWKVTPDPKATNATLLNGRAITSPQEVKDGDFLSVGNESKGVIKLPFLVNPDIEGAECLGDGYKPFLILKPISEEEAKSILAEKGMDAPPVEETPTEEAPAEEDAKEEETADEEASAEEAPAEETTPEKRKGTVDIVFLIDATQSMQPALEALKRNIGTFVDDWICNEDEEGNPVGDWRAKVVGYRDVTDDTAPPLEGNPFVHNDADALKAQLQALQTQGDDKGPSSLLDTIYHVANMGQTDKAAEELDSNKWRYRLSAARVVLIFTDAPYHPKTKEGGTLDDIVNACGCNRILLGIFAPEMECYDLLCEIDRSEYEAIEVQSGETGAEALARPNQLEALKKHMEWRLEPPDVEDDIVGPLD